MHYSHIAESVIHAYHVCPNTVTAFDYTIIWQHQAIPFQHLPQQKHIINLLTCDTAHVYSVVDFKHMCCTNMCTGT